MNGLEITVIVIIAVCVLVGYYTGFLRVLYSLAAWILVLAFVTWTTPYMTDFLEKNTNMSNAIQEKCIEYMSEMAKDKTTDIFVPESAIGEIPEIGAAVIGGILETSGLYEEMAAKIAHFIIEGIAFFITMTIAGMLAFWISHMLNIISRIPVIQGPNKALGAVAGGLKGLVIIWLMFYVIDLCAASEIGKQLHNYIEESQVLGVLYENNILLKIIRIFI